MFKKLFLLLILILGLPVCVNAEPSITAFSGTFFHGGGITISGSGFGANLAVGTSKLQFINAESGTVGEEISEPGWTNSPQSEGEGFNAVCYDNEQSHSGSKSLLCKFDLDPRRWGSVFSYDYGAPITKIYATWWVYFNPISGIDQQGWYNQWKSFRLDPTASVSDQCPEIYVPQWYDPRDWSYSQASISVRAGMLPDGETAWYGDVDKTPPFQWVRMEIYAVESDIDTQNGTIIHTIHKQTSPVHTIKNWDKNVQTRTSSLYNDEPCTGHWQWMHFGQYWGNGGKDAKIWYDDIFLQFGTQARVEIGNNPTWANCSHREIQNPTAWTDDGTPGGASITVTVNQGAFTDEENVYLFVVDADGIPSSGYGPITIGSGGGADTTPPGDVTAFTAQPGDGQIVLSWVNPTDSDFKGTFISYSTGNDPYPATHNDGVIVCDREANFGSSDSFPVTGLDNGTKYNFSAFTYDKSGNYSKTAHVSATPTASPNVSPTASASTNPTSGIVPLSVNFTGSGTDSDGTIDSYHWDFGDGASSNEQNPSHTYNNTGTYTATLTVTDDDGATGNDSVNISVSSKSDTTSPTISNTGTSNITGSSATVTWTTDELADSVVKYSLTSGSYTDSKSDSEYVTEHSITLTGLSENTTCYFVVNSTDPSGNSAQSSEYSFTTTIGYALDVPLKWNANSEPNLAGYKVYYKTGFSGGPPYNGTGATEGDSPINVGNVTSYTLHGLSDSDTYFFAVTAYDNQGRESEYSNEVTTLSTLRVTNITSSTPNGSYTTGKNVDITVNFSEEATLAGGNLVVALNTARTIEIEPFTSQTSVSGTYTVQAGDNSSDLNVNSLTLSGGTLQNTEGTDCNLSLPTGSNLADNKDIEIDTTPLPDTTDPTITITSPISGGTYITDQSTITLSGAASDNVGVTSVTWTNSRGGSGTASGTTNWTISAIPLHCGNDNVITITAKDAANNAASATLTVDVKPCPPSGL